MKCKFKYRKQDGMYGWIVVIMSFLIQFIVDGINYSFGILLVEWIEEFDLDRSQVAVTGSVLVGLLCLTSPLAAALSDKYGCRIVIVFGAIISCAGLIVSSFATNIVQLYLTFGVLTGIGSGLMYLPAGVCVIWYFQKYRGLAYGISMSGSGVGAFVLNNLGRYLIDKYSWRGFVLIMAGLMLQCVPFALLLIRPIKETELPQDDEASENHIDVCMFEDIQNNVTPTGVLDNPTFQKEDTQSTCVKASENNERRYEINTSIIEINKRRNQTGIRSNSSTGSKESKIVYSGTQVNNEGKDGDHKHLVRSLCYSLCSAELLKDKKFCAILLATVLVFLAFLVPYHFTADHAIEVGMSKYEASWLTSSMGLTDAFGRTVIGLLADRKFVNRPVLLLVLLLLAGTSTCCSFMFTTFTARMIYTCAYGLSTGGYYTLMNIVLAGIYGVEKIAKSIGFVMLAMGIALTLSTPFAGMLFDQTGSYKVTFIVAGSELVVAGLIVFITIQFYRKHNVAK